MRAARAGFSTSRHSASKRPRGSPNSANIDAFRAGVSVPFIVRRSRPNMDGNSNAWSVVCMAAPFFGWGQPNRDA